MIDLLQCPDDAHPLTPVSLSREGEPGVWGTESALKCVECGTAYPIKDGVPRFIGEAVDEGFDYRWERNPRPQATTDGVFEQKTGWKRGALDGKIVLDAGCGIGRFSVSAQEWGAKQVVGLDGSTHGIAAAVKNVGERFSAVQGDLLKLPLRDESVDAAFSIGVLHHTASTKDAFQRVAKTVKRGGELAVWLYPQPVPDTLLPALDFLHEITRACPPDVLYDIIERHADSMRASILLPHAHDARVAQSLLRISSSRDPVEMISDTFDWHTPRYRYWHTEAEVRGWFDDAGYDVVWTGWSPVSVRGVKR